MSQFIRTQMLIGKDNVEKLKNSTVIVFGVGGVGSYVCEALARAGVGKLVIIDGDKVCKSNINRQIIALNSTVGKAKVSVMEQRLKDINPEIKVDAHELFYTKENASKVSFEGVSYIVDAIDTVTSKLYIIKKAKEMNIPIISSMGTGNKLDATSFKISDISKTSVCPLARTMRRELKKCGIDKLKVLWSDEKPITLSFFEESENDRKRTPASISFVPSVAGLLIAGEVVRDVIK